MPRTLAALTKAGGIYPEYLNISEHDDGSVSVKLRQSIAAVPGTTPRPIEAEVRFTAAQWADIKAQLG